MDTGNRMHKHEVITKAVLCEKGWMSVSLAKNCVDMGDVYLGTRGWELQLTQ